MVQLPQRGFPAGIDASGTYYLHVAHIPAAFCLLVLVVTSPVMPLPSPHSPLHTHTHTHKHIFGSSSVSSLMREQEETKPWRAGAPEMSIHHSTLLCLGVLLMTSGGIVIFSSGTLYHASLPLMVLGIFLGMGGLSVVVAGVCMAKKNLQVGVPGHFLLHPPTGTRFSPQQALAIQRRLDRIRREMSTDAASTSPEPEPSLPSTPPPWTMEPPPSYDTVMKSQHINQEANQEANQEHGEQPNYEDNEQQPSNPEHTECTNQDGSQQV